MSDFRCPAPEVCPPPGHESPLSLQPQGHTVKSQLPMQARHICSPMLLVHAPPQEDRQQYPESPPHCATTPLMYSNTSKGRLRDLSVFAAIVMMVLKVDLVFWCRCEELRD